MRRTTVPDLIDRYDAFLLDAYGVLVSSRGALPGAAAFLDRLREAGRPFLIVSNDASRSVSTSLARYRGFGLSLEPEQILTSGLLPVDHYAGAGLRGAPTIVLGTDDSRRYVEEAGGVVVAADDDGAEVLVVADDDGYPFLETVNDALTVLLRRLDAGKETRLLLPNPDLLFLRGDRLYGVTSGAIAAMIEAVLALRVAAPAAPPRFLALGKPHLPMFEAAVRRLPAVEKRRLVMVGDQLVTDIAGANAFGIDSVFVESGVGRFDPGCAGAVRPTWVMAGVDPG